MKKISAVLAVFSWYPVWPLPNRPEKYGCDTERVLRLRSVMAAQAPYLLIFDKKGKLVEAIENSLKGKYGGWEDNAGAYR